MVLEAAIDDFNTAKIAVEHGVNRLEVCSDLANDGLTPDVDLFIKCIELKVPCFAMIRPQKGDFTVNKSNFLLMQQQINKFKNLGASGLVLGILTDNYEVDTEKVTTLVKLADPLPITFHKAIDVTKNILKSAESLLSTGVKRILTSGGCSSVLEGIPVIKQMYSILGGKITLVAGGKVTYNNLPQIKQELPFCEFHGRNIVKLN